MPLNMPRFHKTEFDGLVLIVPVRHCDARGFFSETYNRTAFHDIGIACDFVQDNQSFSRARGTIRGLHFQIPPFAQAKLIRVLRGAICDVAVDIRRSASTYGRSFATTLSAENGAQLFIPAGFAHGFCTLEPDTDVLYKVDAPHSREHERGLRWDDPMLGIDWPVLESEATILERDRLHPNLHDLPEFYG
jgi:dTDP-4-dehydrorhamnose 3,5-epimerase